MIKGNTCKHTTNHFVSSNNLVNKKHTKDEEGSNRQIIQ